MTGDPASATAHPTRSAAGSPLASRYGRDRAGRRRGRILAAIVAGAAIAAVAAWITFSGLIGAAGATTTVTTLGFETHGDRSVTVQWQVQGDASHRLICSVEAQAEDRSVVGLVTVVVPAGAGTRGGTTLVRTVRGSVTGLLSSCRRA